MKPSKFHHLAGAIILTCFLSQSNASTTYNVYFTDPETGCIYGKTANSDIEDPYLVSGQTTLSASHIHIIDEHRILFTQFESPNSIIYTDTSTQKVENLNIVPPGHTVQEIAGALSENAFLFITDNNSTSTLYSAAYNATTDSWDPSPEYSWERFHYRDDLQIIQITPEKYILLDNEEHLYLIDTSLPSSTLTLITENRYAYYQHIAKGPDSSWVYSGVGGEPDYLTLFYDSDGNQITPDESQGTLLEENLTRLFWSEHPPQLLGLTATEILSQSDGQYTEPPKILYSSTDSEGNLIPEKDFKWIQLLKPLEQGTKWIGYDYYTEMPFEIDTETGTRKSIFTLEKGTGPYMGDILAMDSGNDGNLYILSIQYGRQSIYMVNPKSGDRTLICEKLPNIFDPFILVNGEGHFLVAKKTYSPQPDSTLLCGTSVHEIIPTQNSTDYQCQQVAFEAGLAMIDDMTLNAEEEFNILYNQRTDQFISKVSDSDFSPSISHITFTEYSLDQDTAYPTIEKPAQITVNTGVEGARFLTIEMNFQLSDPASNTTFAYQLTDPSGAVYTGANYCDRDKTDTAQGTILFPVKTNKESPAGTWQLALTNPIVEQPLSISQITNIAFKFHQAPYAKQITFTSPTTITTYNAYTPSLTTMNTETSAFETLPITNPPEDMITAADFQHAPDGTFYLSTTSECNIYQITSQGDVDLFATRPSTFPTDVLGMIVSTNSPSIAFGPPIQLGPISTTGRVWWLFQ